MAPQTSETKKRRADEAEDAAQASPPPKAKKTKKKSADSAIITPAHDTETAAGQAGDDAATKTASRGSKRKRADQDAAAPVPSPKKAKKETKAAAKPRQTKRTKKVTAVEPPPQPPSPVEVTAPVQAKIDAVKRFLNAEMAHEDTKLKRDSDNDRIITIPELDLLGVVMTLYFHWQMGHAETEASTADLAEAITSTFKAPIGTYGDVDWVTVDLSIPTAFEKKIKEKIAHHRLEDVSLLEIEMELCARRNLIRAGLYQWEAERIMQTGDFLRELVEEGWYGQGKIQRQTDALRMRGLDEKETEKRGVCPAPAVEIV